MIIISKNGLDKNNITINEMIALLMINYQCNIELIAESLKNKGYIVNNTELFAKVPYKITNSGAEIIESVTADSMVTKDNDTSLISLADELKKIYPKGKKDGTNYYWADGVQLIVKRLKLFFKKYGDKYSYQQIIDATKKYIESFNGDYRYMKLLKYFIFKDKVGAINVEEESELVNYIENSNEDSLIKNNWDSVLK